MALWRHKGLEAGALGERVTAAKAAGEDPTAVLAELVRTVGEGMGMIGCDVYGYDAVVGALIGAAAWPGGDEGEGPWIGTRYPLHEWPSLQAVVASPGPTQTRIDGPGLNERERSDLVAWGIGAAMGVRLEADGRIIGALVVSQRKARDFDAGEVDTLRRCAVPVGAAVEWAASRDPGR
jgi:hypothetical protein